MARKKDVPIIEVAREENQKFNDLRFKNGVEGVAAKEERAVEKWMEQVRDSTSKFKNK